MPFWPFTKKDRTPPPPPPGTVAGVVPCAHDDGRMGRSTALLDAGGRSFLAATIGALVGGGCRPVVVILREGQEDERRKAEAAGAVVLPIPDPDGGAVPSVRVALRALEGQVEGVALLPVDHPLVRPETVQRLVEAFREGGAPVVVPVHEGERGRPVLVRHTVFAELLDPEAEEGLDGVLRAHRNETLAVEVDDPGVEIAIDTPEAYRAAFPRPARP